VAQRICTPRPSTYTKTTSTLAEAGKPQMTLASRTAAVTSKQQCRCGCAWSARHNQPLAAVQLRATTHTVRCYQVAYNNDYTEALQSSAQTQLPGNTRNLTHTTTSCDIILYKESTTELAAACMPQAHDSRQPKHVAVWLRTQKLNCTRHATIAWQQQLIPLPQAGGCIDNSFHVPEHNRTIPPC
jgi:hypothetical protein